MSWPSLPHVVYIPLILGVGFALGWSLAARAVRAEWARADKRRRAQEEG